MYNLNLKKVKILHFLWSENLDHLQFQLLKKNLSWINSYD